MKILDWLFGRRRNPKPKPLVEVVATEAMSKAIQMKIETELFGHPTSTNLNPPSVGSVTGEEIIATVQAYKQLFGQVEQPDLPGMETELDKWIREVEFAALSRGFNLRKGGRAILPESLSPEGWHDCLHPAIRFAPDEMTDDYVYFFTAPDIDLMKWNGLPYLTPPQPKQGITNTA